jgi:molybdate transport system substrate-binding protein
MSLRRRSILGAGPALLVISQALADTTLAFADTTDLAVTCDTAAAPAVARAAAAFTARTRVRVRVHPTAPGLVLPQLERDIQNDILVSQTALLDQADVKGLVTPGGRTPLGRNRLVVAAANQPAGPAGSFAAPDATPGSDIDGPAILQHLGITPTIGVIDTHAVAWLLTNGASLRGLLHMSEVATDGRLRATQPVPDDAWPPIVYAATVTRLASRPNPQAFVDFLGSPDGWTILQAAGLETMT